MCAIDFHRYRYVCVHFAFPNTCFRQWHIVLEWMDGFVNTYVSNVMMDEHEWPELSSTPH